MGFSKPLYEYDQASGIYTATDAATGLTVRFRPSLSDSIDESFRKAVEEKIKESRSAVENDRNNALEYAFRFLSQVHQDRNDRWQGNGPGYTILEKAAEMGGECGEAQNVAKKIRRIELGMVGNKPGQRTRAELDDMLEREIGDVIICAINLANKGKLDVLRGLRNAFNDKSAELGFPERI